ncbi:molecular chaperone [Salmonella enterica]|nr:molecular chaperone [Salmonella enterica]
MINVRLPVIFLSIFFSAYAPAFQVDTLSKIILKDDDSLILTGDTGREYLYTSLSRVRVDRMGNIHEDLLTPENIENWPVIVDPGEVILDQGDEVRVRINRNGPQDQDDIVLGLSFIPERTINNRAKGSGLQVSVGYKAWLFIPGKAPLSGDVTAYRKANKIIIDNTTNKILRIMVHGDNRSGSGDGTDNSLMSLPGTKKEIDATKGKLILDFYGIDSAQKKVKELTL